MLYEVRWLKFASLVAAVLAEAVDYRAAGISTHQVLLGQALYRGQIGAFLLLGDRCHFLRRDFVSGFENSEQSGPLLGIIQNGKARTRATTAQVTQPKASKIQDEQRI